MPEFGRLVSEDPRDKDYPLARLLSAPVGVPQGLVSPFPGDYYYQFIPPALDQGAVGACVGYSWRGWLTQYPINTLGGPSGLDIYHEAQEIDEWPGNNYEGTSVRAGVKVLQSKGHVANYYWAGSVEEIILAIKTQGPVIMGTNWYSGMMNPGSGGIVSVSGGNVGGHAWMVYGYSTNYRAFAALNSWGPTWGQNGTFWIYERDLARLFSEDGEACVATEKSLGSFDIVIRPLPVGMGFKL